jgi:hypothetical protein
MKGAMMRTLKAVLDFTVAMVNDHDRSRTGKLNVSFSNAEGKEIPGEGLPFVLAPLGAESFTITLKFPEAPGKYLVQAIAIPADDTGHTTISHRDTIVQLSAPGK